MNRIVRCAIIVALLAPALFAALPSTEDKVWSLEKAYWEYVKANDLQRYRALWHTDFLGWPTMDPEPVRKDHITDWIITHTSKGDTFKSYDLERLTTQVTDNLATVTYRVRLTWADKNGAGESSTLRVIHTWLRNVRGNWQIISGMSAPTNAEGH